MTIAVGFVGLGNMGNPMAMNLLKKGYALTVFDLHRAAMQNLVAEGAKGAASSAEAVAHCDVLFTSLPGTPEVGAFYLGENGAVARAKFGAALVDLSSVLPSTPRNFEPGFKVALMNKDLDTFHAIAKEVHVPVSFSNMAQHYQQAALAAGLGEKDTSVILR